MSSFKLEIGVVQATPALFDLQGSVTKTVQWIEKAADAGCELVLFPESFIPCYPRGLRYDAQVGKRTEKSRDHWLDYWNNSFETDSQEAQRISAAVRKAGIFVALGVTEKEPVGGSLYCTLIYFNTDGQIVGKHRKLKPTGLERYLWAEGDGATLTTLNTSFGRIGGLICWENYMPLARTAMYKKGVEIYLAPTADMRDSWQSTMEHIALEGRCFVLAANQFVRKSDYPEYYQPQLTAEPEIMSSGGSVIYAPTGELMAGPLWNEEGLLTAELDFDLLRRVKLDFDVVGHYARNDVFDLKICNQPETIDLRKNKE
ncbi:MAG: carbon-nitrogen hydrolase family protein [Bacteroidota bacterium]